jgi:Fic-DOC domain mobile mystery protein B
MGGSMIYNEDKILPGQTLIDCDELKDLIPGHITLILELNQFESQNILEAQKKYLQGRQRRFALDNPEILKRIHHDMFSHTWKWAGQYRQSNKNLGVTWQNIPEEMKKACDDFVYWKEHKTFSPTEIAVRFHHRLVSIHPFPNGNGRHARLVSDIFLREMNEKPLTWGSGDFFQKTPDRDAYIKALQKADAKDFTDLIQFARS